MPNDICDMNICHINVLGKDKKEFTLVQVMPRYNTTSTNLLRYVYSTISLVLGNSIKSANQIAEIRYQYEYESVLANGFYFDGGKVVEAYYYPKAKEVWFVLSAIDFTLRRNFSKKARLTWKSYCRDIIPIITSEERFQKELMPQGAIKLKVGI